MQTECHSEPAASRATRSTTNADIAVDFAREFQLNRERQPSGDKHIPAWSDLTDVQVGHSRQFAKHQCSIGAAKSEGI